MKKITLIIIACLLSLQVFAKEAKYVFYFIGDGMGINLVTFTEYYKAAKEGKHGTLPLNFAQFPVSSVATTWSANSLVTDSAASGTALSTGTKTKNAAIGTDADGKVLETIAEKAHKAGKKVAILTNVGVNHATPAVFYAHQPNRNNYDQIALELAACDFEFLSGSEVMKSKKDKIEGLNIKAECEKGGFSYVTNNNEYKNAFKKADKMIYISGETKLPLCDRVDAATKFLMKGGCKEGFFMMVEGGRIDGKAHGNDIAGVVEQILKFEEAVAYAIDFYNKHPEETAILVTADHDTGGSALLFGDKKCSPTVIDNQKTSIGDLTKALKKRMETEKLSWEDVKDFLSDNLGLWSEVKVSKDEEKKLKKIYDETIALANAGNVTDDFGYNNNAEIVYEAAQVLAYHAGIKFNTKSHSASMVPVCYMGPKQEIFTGRLDNAMLPGKIEQILLQK